MQTLHDATCKTTVAASCSDNTKATQINVTNNSVILLPHLFCYLVLNLVANICYHQKNWISRHGVGLRSRVRSHTGHASLLKSRQFHLPPFASVPTLLGRYLRWTSPVHESQYSCTLKVNNNNNNGRNGSCLTWLATSLEKRRWLKVACAKWNASRVQMTLPTYICQAMSACLYIYPNWNNQQNKPLDYHNNKVLFNLRRCNHCNMCCCFSMQIMQSLQCVCCCSICVITQLSL